MALGPEKRRLTRGRLRFRKRDGNRDPAPDELVEMDGAELTGVFAVPSWLRDIGFTAWLLIGVMLFLVGIVWILSLTQVIVIPVLTAAVVASVASPLVGWGHRHGAHGGLASAALLAIDLHVDVLAIVTDVDAVYEG